MKIHIFLILFMFCKINCKAQNTLNAPQGMYKVKGSSIHLELKADSTYMISNPKSSGHFELEQCSYSSKGRWKQIGNDVLEIVSENFYQKQDGFKYELKKQNKFSPDSLYIEVYLPESLIYYKNGTPVFFSYTFNDDVSKHISTNANLIRLPKQKYLWSKTSNSVNRNHLTFSINANISGVTSYKSRIMFDILEEDIDTEKTNYLTITLPYFDLCFFEFELYNHDLLFIKNNKELLWQGESWEKQID
ncbi:MAG: hypothetical protein H7223_08035 [Pedobacter sp.]|nr:hypothetical protein [Pedobacter sp.]